MGDNRVLEAMEFLVAAYPSFDLRQETLRIYVEFLRDVDPHVLREAIRRHIAGSQWFPKVNELLAETRKVSEDWRSGRWNPDSELQRRMEQFQELSLELQTLSDDYVYELYFDGAAWRDLIDRAEKAGREALASTARRRMEHIQHECEAVP